MFVVMEVGLIFEAVKQAQGFFDFSGFGSQMVEIAGSEDFLSVFVGIACLGDFSFKFFL